MTQKDLTLVVLAAGIGSRYGGLKQLETVGPAGETLMDYCLYDAMRTGFRKIVFVIRKDFHQAFASRVGRVFGKSVPHPCVFQELGDLPGGMKPPSGRSKPWGTGHALLACRKEVDGPFGVINADDYYGRKSFAVLVEFLRGVKRSDARYCMVGFALGNTLSEHGPVSRGVCRVSPDGLLSDIVETTGLKRDGDLIKGDPGGGGPLDPSTPVSMNMWGFTPAVFDSFDRQFREFIAANGADGKAEFYIPAAVQRIIGEGGGTVKVLSTPEKWFGITYQGDRPAAADRINKLIKLCEYPPDVRF